MSYAHTTLIEVVEHVKNCVCATLIETAEAVDGHPTCPCRSCAVPGPTTSIQTVCCGGCENNDGGSLTVNVNRLYPSVGFPRQDPNADVCAPTVLVADVTIRLLRCIHVWADPDSAEAVTCAQLQEDADIANVDAMSLLRAAQCCVPDRPGRRKPMKTVVSGLTAVSDGNCAGWTMQLLLDLGPCGCPEVEPS